MSAVPRAIIVIAELLLVALREVIGGLGEDARPRATANADARELFRQLAEVAMSRV
jgi:hypothetical protein